MTVGSAPIDVAIGDFNGDGKPDLVSADQSDGTVSVLLATNGLGSFATPATHVKVGSSPESIAVGDLNRDGKADVAVANVGSSSVSVLLGTATGLGAAKTIKLPGSTSDVAIADATGDGKLDVLATSDADVVVYPGNGTGGVGSPVSHATGCGTGAQSVAFGDVTGDGKGDIVAGCGDQTVRVLAGNGSGSFGAPSTAPTTGSAQVVAVHLTIADMNEDGRPDLLLPDSNVSRLALLLGNVSGGFAHSNVAPGSPFTLAPGSGSGTEPYDIGVADLNGDSHLDAVTGGGGLIDDARVLIGDGSGSFEPSSPGSTKVGFLVSTGTNTAPLGVAVGDLNGDGRPDFVTSDAGSNQLSVFLNTTPIPGARTDAATGVGQHAATLNGVVNPEGTDTTYRFEYGATTAYGNQTPVFPTGASLSGSADQPVSAQLSGLTAGAIYHFRLVATNGNGTTRGRDMAFRAGTAPPVNTSLPRIAGTAKVGKTVTCLRGAWTGNPSFRLRWLLNGNLVNGKTSSVFKLPASAALKALQCEVRATNAGGSVTKQSKPVAVVPITCKVPNVVNLRLGKAKKRIRRAGCKVAKISKVNAAHSLKGRVIDQDIPPGTKVSGGTKIKLTVGE